MSNNVGGLIVLLAGVLAILLAGDPAGQRPGHHCYHKRTTFDASRFFCWSLPPVRRYGAWFGLLLDPPQA